MIVNTNISSLNAQRNLYGTQNAMQKSLEKLSSGYRINKAADDAAGLAITEKMTGQINGLNQAVRNAQSAISLIQTAEGALSESHSILQRMRELAVQSASDTNTADDRMKLQAEVDQLSKELTRISNTTEFNTQNLLAGGLNDTFHIGANSGQNVQLSIGAMDAQSLGVAGFLTTGTINSAATGINSVTMDRTVGTSMGNGTTQNYTVSDTGAKTTFDGSTTGFTGMTITSTENSSKYNDYKIIVDNTLAGGATTTAAVDGNAKTITISLASDHDAVVTATEVKDAFTAAGIGDLIATGDSSAGGTSGHAATAASGQGLGDDELLFTLNGEEVIVKEEATQVKFSSASNLGVTLNKNAEATAATDFTNNNFDVSVSSSSIAEINPDGSVKVDAEAAVGINISTQSKADDAITIINNALEAVSAQRSTLGAMQNRLDHTINNLQAAGENLTSARSTIKDVDMAAEMSEFTKSQILSQAGVAMLAQANQVPQAVLKLLG